MALEIAVIYDDVLDYMKIVFFRLQYEQLQIHIYIYITIYSVYM